jgi:hypothetical protein
VTSLIPRTGLSLLEALIPPQWNPVSTEESNRLVGLVDRKAQQS